MSLLELNGVISYRSHDVGAPDILSAGGIATEEVKGGAADFGMAAFDGDEEQGCYDMSFKSEHG